MCLMRQPQRSKSWIDSPAQMATASTGQRHVTLLSQSRNALSSQCCSQYRWLWSEKSRPGLKGASTGSR